MISVEEFGSHQAPEQSKQTNTIDSKHTLSDVAEPFIMTFLTRIGKYLNVCFLFYIFSF